MGPAGDSLSRTRPDPTGRFLRPSLDQAIVNWKAVNCSDGDCPRPILVAASGGASCAGFFTAATLGEIIDRTRGKTGLNDFQRQLFAISSVSGSSTGAAFFAAALREARPDGSNPCNGPDRTRLVYFNGAPTDWRHCMEQLLAGDFISSTLMAYVYKDAIRGLAALATKLGLLQVPDRAAVLERSWEQQFCRNAGAPCNTTEFQGLEAPFLKVAAQTDQDRAQRKWFPLLFFNSTDVDTGRRIVVSPVASHMRSKANFGARIFVDAYDFHDLLAYLPSSKKGRDPSEQAAQVDGNLDRDVSLSTAALLSARFPIISPPANVLNKKDNVVARVIDGGYFENFGAATAQELGKQLKQAGLSPFIIEITNDPELLVSHRIKKPGTNALDSETLRRESRRSPMRAGSANHRRRVCLLVFRYPGTAQRSLR